MTDLLQAFLDDIVAHPDDPSLWLILADWLEERADPRAELVRLTWQLQYEADHADFAIRQTRVQALLAGGMIPVRPRCTLDDIEFAWIAPGSFLMGSPPDEQERRLNEKQHRVPLTAGFWMGVFPITQGQWCAVMGSNPSFFSRKGGGKRKVARISDADLERLPVENVSWNLAQEFCARLGQGVRLPSEARWEYACRAGTRTPFHCGAILNGKEANCRGKHPYGTKQKGPYLERPSVVGSYPPNAWGLADLHGNVLEWCLDAHREDYESLPPEDPLSEQEDAGRRVLRGGSWGGYAHGCRAASRDFFEPTFRSYAVGFRVVVPCRQ